MKNWKTTLMGLIGAILSVIGPMVSNGNLDSVNWQSVGVAATLAGVGFFSKDSDVTGGSRVQ